jgi:hypothetical protein
MGTQWESDIDQEVERLRETIVELQSHRTHVAIMLLPQATWVEDLPFKIRYDAKIRAVCQETSTPLIDFSHVMRDSIFVDGGHLTVGGQEVFRQRIMESVSKHLQTIKGAYGS